MLNNMTTGEKALIGATAIGIAALVFHKPTRNAVGLSDGKRARYIKANQNTKKLHRQLINMGLEPNSLELKKSKRKNRRNKMG